MGDINQRLQLELIKGTAYLLGHADEIIGYFR